MATYNKQLSRKSAVICHSLPRHVRREISCEGFPFSVTGPSWQDRRHSQQKPSSFAVPAVQCGAGGFMNPDPAPAELGRGLAASQRKCTTPCPESYLEPGLS